MGSTGKKQEPGPRGAGDAEARGAFRQRVACAPVGSKGRGVIALEDVPAGAEVERAPVIPVPASELLEVEGHHTVFDQYLLYWSDEPGAEVAMGCGLLMIYNHSSNPNVEFHTGPDPLTMSVITTRAVKAGEELVYDYDVELWFTPA